MNETPTASSPGRGAKAAGWALSVLSILFLLFDGIGKIVKPPQVVEATTKLGYPAGAITGTGIVLLLCTLLYAAPPTSFLGAILLTGYLGGAVAINVSAGTPAFNLIFPVIFGAMVWGGLFLRDAYLRALIIGKLASQARATNNGLSSV